MTTYVDTTLSPPPGTDLATDRRNFRHEAFEEVVDMAVYMACDRVRP